MGWGFPGPLSWHPGGTQPHGDPSMPYVPVRTFFDVFAWQGGRAGFLGDLNGRRPAVGANQPRAPSKKPEDNPNIVGAVNIDEQRAYSACQGPQDAPHKVPPEARGGDRWNDSNGGMPVASFRACPRPSLQNVTILGCREETQSEGTLARIPGARLLDRQAVISRARQIAAGATFRAYRCAKANN